MNIIEYLNERRVKIDLTLEKLLPFPKSYPQTLSEAMNYTVFIGGKRIRPILCLAACEAIQGSMDLALPIACALEIIHTYSLIHDDLPPMDNDDYRRGQPTNHLKFGEAHAILAGDALLTLAFQIISAAGLKSALAERVYLQIINDISIAIGNKGMIGGQTIDLLSENISVDLKTLRDIHSRKTGALISVSLKSGAMLAGGSEEQIKSLTLYGDYLGLAFQITDDLLDVLGDEQKTGKPCGSDLKNHKSTYPSLLGIPKTRQLAEQTIDNALHALQVFGPEADQLRLLAKYLLVRDC